MCGGAEVKSWQWATMAPEPMTTAAIAAFAALASQNGAQFEGDVGLALGVAGLTPQTARLDLDTVAFYRDSRFECLWTGRFQARPWRAPFEADMVRRQLTVARANPGTTIEVASRLLGEGARLSLLGDPVEGLARATGEAGALEKVLSRMKGMGLVTSEVPNLATVPEGAQRAAAAVLSAALERHEGFRASVMAVSNLDAQREEWKKLPDMGSPAAALKAVRFLSAVDLRSMFVAAQGVGYAVMFAEAQARLVPPTAKYRVKITTAWGPIILSGGTDDTYSGEPPLLLIDTGGKDVYLDIPRTGSGQAWLSVTIDTSGDDVYLSEPSLAQTTVAKSASRGAKRGERGCGSALFGVTFLVDSAGNDVYRSLSPAYGSATFGSAFVLDLEGDDVYDAYADSLGYAWFGIGVVEDVSGQDQYRVFTQGQGCGMPMGFGGLFDRGGDDMYLAEDTVIDFPSPQTQDHNVSLAQGAGYGIRSDFSSGHSLSGGIGLLLDEGGNDSYRCGVFGQGSGYWDGVGLMWDMAGNDIYLGQWYVQGASAHFGIGYLEDLAGDDIYRAEMNMALGAGHDFGLGYMLDWSGNDRYTGPNLSLGAGNANGIGVFYDADGDDVYEASGLTLGSASEGQKASLRERTFSLGLFCDRAGTDTYPQAATWARNAGKAVNWASRTDDPSTSQLGVFLDRP